MKVHHLNCGTLRLPFATLVCHVLLVETAKDLVLVDAGFGLLDIADPATRLGVPRYVNRPTLDPAQTAVNQIRALGLDPRDVRHVIATHLDSDHIGGLADFPDATLHLTAAEALGAMHAPTRAERYRYNPLLWAHAAKIVEHQAEGESWRGFTAQELTDIGPGIVLVPMPGHTRGHTAVAVDAGERWVLHAGDAFMHPGRVDGRTPVPVLHSLMENMLAHDRALVRDNHARLAHLYQSSGPDLLIVCGHDRGMFEHAVATA
ncbi:MBL fold metallo-hydrolase [Nocardia sp. CDC160]|uniref:MBL fold metallo-hydrolase n=1 Tax=Nocardia sp. CDC160 TaxID=3112166 RepID=UPI002DBE4CA1|nr:MBL fold metallo-hydrolase [Nocardia sp. CDC160]MEC3916211.1 MBL fold metallo-hydrolase [Nocardia sp. CDC160]